MDYFDYFRPIFPGSVFTPFVLQAAQQMAQRNQYPSYSGQLDNRQVYTGADNSWQYIDPNYAFAGIDPRYVVDVNPNVLHGPMHHDMLGDDRFDPRVIYPGSRAPRPRVNSAPDWGASIMPPSDEYAL